MCSFALDADDTGLVTGSPSALGRARTEINSNPHSLRAANSFHIASSYRRTYAIKFSRLKNEHVIDSGSEPAFSASTVSSFKKKWSRSNQVTWGFKVP